MTGRDARRRSGGFVLIAAITLLALAATALVLIGHLTDADARSTARECIDTQLRLLLLAGGRGAADAADGPTSVDAPLPDVTLSRVARTDDADRVVVVTATFAGRRASQTLRYRRAGDGWTLVAAGFGASRRLAP